MCRLHVDALDPPEALVAPITPFKGDHECSDDTPLLLSDQIEPELRIFQQAGHTSTHRFRVQLAAFCLLGHGHIERGQNRRVLLLGQANLQLIASRSTPVILGRWNTQGHHISGKATGRPDR